MPRSKEAIKRAKSNYEKNNIKRVYFKLHNKYDENIISHLESKENVTAYIKQLIRSDIEKGGE